MNLEKNILRKKQHTKFVLEVTERSVPKERAKLQCNLLLTNFVKSTYERSAGKFFLNFRSPVVALDGNFR